MFKLADWFHEHGQKVVYGAIVVVAILIFALVWTQQRKGASEKAYVSAEIAFDKFFRLASDQTDPAKEEPFVTLKEAMEDHPELGARYNRSYRPGISSCGCDGTRSCLWGSSFKAFI